jgi:hypothetical protein
MFEVKFFGPQVVVSHNLEQVLAIWEFCLKIDYLLFCNFEGSYESQPDYPKRISLSLSLAELFAFSKTLDRIRMSKHTHTSTILYFKKSAACSVI